MGHLAFVGSHKVNGVSALHTDLMQRDGVPRPRTRSIPTASSTRPTASPSAAGCSRPIRGSTELITDAIGAGVPGRREALGGLAPFADDASVPGALRRACGARTRTRLRDLIADRLGDQARPGGAVRRADQAHPRIQAPAAQHPARRSRSTTRSARTPTHDWVPRVKIFAGKAAASYHQAKLIIKLDQRRRPGGQQRSDGARPAQGRVPAELQREPRRGDHSGRRPLRADLDGRHGSLRHRQHEVRAQRRADHRHARRRQRRDPRARRRGQHLHLRPDRRRGRRSGAPRASTHARPSPPRPGCARCSTRWRRACSRPTTPAAMRSSSIF